MKKMMFFVLVFLFNILLTSELYACVNGGCAERGCRCGAEGGMSSCTCKSSQPSNPSNPDNPDSQTTPTTPQYSIDQIVSMMRQQDNGEDDEDFDSILSSLVGTENYNNALTIYRNECKQINKMQKEKQKSDFDGIDVNKDKIKNVKEVTLRVNNKSDSFRKPSVMSFVDAKYIVSYKAYTVARKSSNENLKKAAAHYLRVYKEATAEKIKIMQEDELYTPQNPKNPARKYNEKFSKAHDGNYRNTENIDINNFTAGLAADLEIAANKGKYVDIEQYVNKKFKIPGNSNYVKNSIKRTTKALENDESYGERDKKVEKSGVSDDETFKHGGYNTKSRRGVNQINNETSPNPDTNQDNQDQTDKPGEKDTPNENTTPSINWEMLGGVRIPGTEDEYAESKWLALHPDKTVNDFNKKAQDWANKNPNKSEYDFLKDMNLLK